MAWATASTDGYRYNPFVRATVNVILLQVVLILLTIGVFWWALGYSQTQTSDSLSEHALQDVEGAVQTTTNTQAQSIELVRTRTLMFAFLGIVILAGMFGFLVARFALWPARNSLQFQKRFIGNVAHEIRTPMAIIKTNTEVALMDPTIAPDVREVFEDTVIELDRMSETINNLLTFDTLVRPGSMKLSCVDVGRLAETVTARHQELAATRGVTLDIAVESSIFVLGNTTALDQVVSNLVKNAVNYTPMNEQKSVAVSVHADEDAQVIITVNDEGVGIAQKDLEHVFEPFFRADSSRARNSGTGSSGLGLAIVNEIVRVHHGSISIKSVLNKGTNIKVFLPQVSAPAPRAQQDINEISFAHAGNPKANSSVRHLS